MRLTRQGAARAAVDAPRRREVCRGDELAGTPVGAEVGGVKDLRVTCTSEPGVFLVSEGDTVVATVNAGRVMAGKELAYAMAAAPELLAACNEAFDFLGGADGAAEIRAKLLASIARAKETNHDRD